MTQYGTQLESIINQPRMQRLQYEVLFLCMAAYLIDGFITTVIGQIGPAMARELHFSRVDMGQIYAASIAGQLVGYAVISALALRLGHRAVMIGCMTGFMILSFVFSLLTDRSDIIAVRFLMGVGLGGVLPSVVALISEFLPFRRRGTGVMMAFVAFSSGAFAATILAAHFGGPGAWREVVRIGGFAALVVAVVIWLRLPESLEFLFRRGRLAAYGTTIARLAPAAAGAFAAQPPGVATVTKASPLALFGREMRLGTVLIWVFVTCSIMTYYSYTDWLPVMLLDSGQSQNGSLFLASALPFGGIIACILSGVFMDRIGPYRVMSAMMAGSGLSILALIELVHAAPGILLGSIFAVGFFTLGSLSAASAVVSFFYPTALRGVGLGWSKSFSRIGAVLAQLSIGVASHSGVPATLILGGFAMPQFVGAGAVLAIGVLAARRAAGAPHGFARAPATVLSRPNRT